MLSAELIVEALLRGTAGSHTTLKHTLNTGYFTYAVFSVYTASARGFVNEFQRPGGTVSFFTFY